MHINFMKWVCLFLGIFTMQALEAGTRTDGEYLHKVKKDFVTPHQEWVASLEGGPIRTLFITNRTYGAREVVELAQRLDLKYEVFVAYNFSNLAVDSIYEAGVLGTSAFEKANELLGKVRPAYDVIVLANVKFSALSEEVRYHILKQVSEGAGLILVYPEQFPYPKVLEAPNENWKDILRMVDEKALPDVAASLAPKQLLQTYQFGKGRVGILAYPNPTTRLGLTSKDTYTPLGWKARYENSMALAARLVQWAAGRDITPSIRPQITEEAIKLTIDNVSKGNVFLRIRDLENRVVWSKELALNGESEMTVPLGHLPAGVFYLDVRWGSNSKISGFGVFRFDRPFEGKSLAVTSDKPFYEQGEKITIAVTLEKPLERDAEAVVQLWDLPEHNLWKKQIIKLPRGETRASVTLEGVHVPTVAGLVKADIRSGDQTLASAFHIAYFPRRDIELFPTILWESLPAELTEMYAAQLDESVHDAAALSHPGDHGERAKLSALFNQRFIPYMTRIGLAAGEKGETVSKHWLGMSNEEALAATSGDGSLNNPAVRDFWAKNIARRIEDLPQVGPMIYTLGDENYFSYDAGYSAADNAVFPKFLQGLYGDIATLNKEWGTDYSSFEAIGHPTPKEMREKSLYPLWYAHRRFMEQQYAETHHHLARAIKEIDPHARVGAEGSVPGDLELTIKELDFWGPYNDPIQDELLRAVAPEKLRTIWWGYGGEFLAYPLWQPLLKGIINGNSWYSSSIEAPSGLMSVDFTLTDYYKKERKPFVDALNRGTAQALISNSLKNHGVAILWSHASYSASVMDDRFLSPRDSAIPIMNFLNSVGLNFSILTSTMVESGALKDYKILWLPGASALSTKEADAISQFVKSGGIAIADINPGVLNNSCALQERSLLAQVFGVEKLKGRAPLRMKAVEIAKEVRGQPIVFKAAKVQQSPEVPMFSVNTLGDGLAILLNFNLSSAANTAEGGIGNLMRPLLKLAGIEPEIRVEGVSKDHFIVKIRENPEGQILGILADREDIEKTASIVLPELVWAYETDKGLIGQTKTINATLDIPFKVFSLFPTEQKVPVFKAKEGNIAAGAAVTLDFTSLSPYGTYRLEVFDPHGKSVRRLTRVFSGNASDDLAILRFALSDAPGKYKVTLTDARTGLAATQMLTVSTPD